MGEKDPQGLQGTVGKNKKPTEMLPVQNHYLGKHCKYHLHCLNPWSRTGIYIGLALRCNVKRQCSPKKPTAGPTVHRKLVGTH